MKKRMHSLIILIIVVTIIFSCGTIVNATKCGDNLYWSVSGSTLTISGIGKMDSSGQHDRPWEDYKDVITTVIIEDGVTSIDNYAFYDFGVLSTVKIADTVKEINGQAFWKCNRLENIELPKNLIKLGEGVFAQTGLESIFIPKSLEKAEGQGYQVGGPFAECNNLKEVRFEENTRTVASNLFHKCSGIEEIVIPDTVIEIGYSAFCSCENLKKISLGKSLNIISEYAFRKCKNLRELVIPNNVTSIKSYAFFECDNLSYVELPLSLETLSEGAFAKTDITIISIPNGIDKCWGVGYEGGGPFANCDKLKTVVFKENIKKIPDNLFYKCTGIYEINIPNTVTSVGDNTFRKCQNLNRIDIHSGIKTFGENTFAECSNLTLHIYSNSYAEEYAKKNNIKYVIEENEQEEEKDNIDEDNYVNSKVNAIYRPSNDKHNKTIKVAYSDSYFINDNSKYDIKLEKISLAASMSSMTAAYKNTGSSEEKVSGANRNANIKDLLVNKLKFNGGYKQYNYEKSLADDSDKVAYSIAHKIVNIDGEKTTIVGVSIRSGNYGSEWTSNGRVGGSETNEMHNGFYKAAKGVITSLGEYIESNNLDKSKLKLWISGFSRGAAVSNIVGKIARQNELVEGNNLYCYCTATPKTTKNNIHLDGIFNTINPIDIVPKVPLEKWAYTWYGRTYYLPYKLSYSNFSSAYKKVQSNFKKITNGESYKIYPNHYILSEDIISNINTRIGGTESAYVSVFQNSVSSALGKFLGKSDKADIEFGKLLTYLGLTRSIINNIGIHIGIAEFESLGFVNDIYKKFNSRLLKQHWPEAYMAYLQTDRVTTRPLGKLITVACPVNVKVYDSKNNIVAEIVNDKYVNNYKNIEEGSVEFYVDSNGTKKIFVPNESDYHVDIKATDNGTMNYAITEFSDDGEAVEKICYNDIRILKGDLFKANVNGGNDNATSEYDLLKNNTEKISASEDLTGNNLNNIIIYIDVLGKGTVAGGGSYSNGDSVCLYATADNDSEFVGWYENDVLVSTSSTYSFIAKNGNDRLLRAKFKPFEKPVKTSISKLKSGKKSLIVSWKKKSVVGYQIQYSLSAKFKKGNKIKTIKNNEKTSVKISKLKGKKKYNVRIRTYKFNGQNNVYSNWSAKKSIRTK